MKNAQPTSWAGMSQRRWGMASPRRVGVSALHTNSRRRGSLFNQEMSQSLKFLNISALESGESFFFINNHHKCGLKGPHGVWFGTRLEFRVESLLTTFMRTEEGFLGYKLIHARSMDLLIWPCLWPDDTWYLKSLKRDVKMHHQWNLIYTLIYTDNVI